jgi:lysozyme
MAMPPPAKFLRRAVILLPVAMLVLLMFRTIPRLLAQKRDYPTVDHLPSGELVITGGKAVLPQGFVLRALYPPGIALTKLSEGWVPHLYNDAAGYCTIGFGHLIKKARCDGTEPAEFQHGVTQQRGGEILAQDLGSSEYTVMKAASVQLKDGQFAALTDFVFNVGSINFRGSTLLQVVNANQFDRVPAQFRRWVNAGGKPLTALKKRRDREVDLFFAGIPQPRGVPAPGEDLSPIDIQTGRSD